MEKEELKNNQEIEEEKELSQKQKGFFGKIGSGLKTGIKSVGEKIGDGIKKVQSNIDEHFEQKQIEKSLEELFNLEATKISLVIIGKKEKVMNVYGKIDYEKKVITIYGENNQLTKECFFIDKHNQKYNISLIRLNQSIELTLESVVYKRLVTVIEFILKDDEDTKKQMQTIINNNQIKIENSVINKSNIGFE